MEADSDWIDMKEIGIIKPQSTSEILALYIVKDKEYGFSMHKDGLFQYFEYDKSESYFGGRIRMGDTRRDFQDAEIISWHFNWQKRLFIFIDADSKVRSLTTTEKMVISKTSKL